MSPTGGEKDTTAPIDTVLIPGNYSVGFSSKSIYIEFDEYIRLNDIHSQLVISPPVQTRPEIKVKKKAITLEFQEELLPQTTYTLNFGDGIVDYNEGNPALDLIYVFSTGNELDSMAFSCKVTDALSTKAKEGIKVLLYDSDIDSLPFLEKPLYFGRTNKDGQALIKNMRAGEYKVCVLEDQNGNYLIDPGESIGFLNEMVRAQPLDSNLNRSILTVSAPLDTLQYISDYSRDSTAHVRLFFNSKNVHPTFRVLNGPEKLTSWCWSGDSLHVWLDGASANGDIDLEVSHKGAVLDTLALLDYKVEPRGELTINHNIKGKVRSDSLLWMSCFDLITVVDTSLISIRVDSQRVRVQRAVSSDMRKAALSAKLLDGKMYEFTALPGAMKTRTGWQNDTIRTRFNTHGKDHYGRVNLAISGIDFENGFLEVLNGKEQLVLRKEIRKDTLIKMARLLPDSYTIRLIDDQNKNGQWDPADYWKKRTAERVFYFPQDLNLRSNWILEFDWILNSPE